MANSQMSTEQVRSTVNSVDESCPTNTPKAVMSGVRTGDKSGAGGHVESEFRPVNSAKGMKDR